ncbi:NAD(P)-dependent glycerol-3-phosphate dehydrogenase [Candidatus Woesearchaeota archaeon]|nr:NAD(P)-dependent glycerol-3-phosphate dehydrogenase [Candidatus Woesearchaeota archaeon]
MGIKNISVVGAGGWGTALSVLLANKGFDVLLWCRRKELSESIQKRRENLKYLKGIKIPSGVKATNDVGCVKNSELVVICVPSEYVRNVLRQAKPFIGKNCVVLSASKGLEAGSSKRMSQVVEEETSSGKVAVLSGPNHSEEVSAGLPTATVIASKSAGTARILKGVFGTDSFKVYTNNDVVGVEVCGAFKNIVAIAVGICDELGLGDNAKGALVTLGLEEMGAFSEAMGGKRLTCYGLAGIGDIITTCESRHSRNRFVGRKLAAGKSVEDIKEEMNGMVAEGVTACKAVYEIGKRKFIRLPLTNQIYKIIYERKSPGNVVGDVLKII